MNTDQGSMGQHVASQVTQYIIPEYQRPYSWDSPDWRVLWSDVLRQYDYVAAVWDEELSETSPEDNESDVATALINTPLHYIGTLVTANPMTVTPPRSTVVDGQQRILTFLILLLAVRDSMIRSRPDDATGIRLRYASLLSNQGHSGNAALRVRPQEADRKAYDFLMDPDRTVSNATIQVGSLPLLASDSDQLIRAYNFFRKQLGMRSLPAVPPFELEGYAHLYRSGGLNNRIIEFVVMNRLYAIKLIADSNDDPNMIFESLNTKGRDLQQADLIKNFLYLSLGGAASNVYKSHWRPMEVLLRPAELEKYAWAYLVSSGENILQKRTYEAVQRKLRGRKPGAVQSFVAAMELESKYFARLLNPEKETNPFIRQALSDVIESGGTTALPLLLYCYRRLQSGQADQPQFLGAVRLIESFLVRRMLCGRFTNNLNSFFGAMCHRLHNDPRYAARGESLPEDVGRVLSSFQSEWPADDDVLDGIKLTPFYRTQHTAQRIRILRALDQYLNHTGVQLDYPQSDKSIEHIAPQDQDAPEWQSEFGGPDGAALRERLDSLGNLTLLPPHINSSLGNKGWLQKRAIYADSAYPLTAQLAEAFAGALSWSLSEMNMRCEAIAVAATELWPRTLVAPHPVEQESPAADDQNGSVDEAVSLLDKEMAGDLAVG